MGKPSVSVIIPCAGMAHFLPNAVGSIQRQDEQVDEILIAHPAHDNDTAEMVRKLAGDGVPVVSLEAPDEGPGPVRNVGLERACGDVIAFLDADDLWSADKLSTQLERLSMAPHVDAVGGMTVQFDVLDKEALAPADNSNTNTDLFPVVGMLICRRTVFDKIGPFDDDLLYSEDLDMHLRMRDFDIPVAVLDVPLLYWRQHDESMTSLPDPRRYTDIRITMLKSIRRRRQLGLPPTDRQVLTGYVEPWPRTSS